MAVVVYKCNVCKREIQLQRNTKGLESTNHCTITHGCRGELYQIDLLEDYIRGDFPKDVAGLDNWQQRKVLYDYAQSVARTEWNIIHNMGTFPSVQAFVDRPTEENPDNREELLPDDIVIINKNTLKLVFDRAWSGVAQLIARSSDPQLLQQREFPTPEPDPGFVGFQLSNSGELTIATRIVDPVTGEESAPTNIGFELTYITPEGTSIPIDYIVDNNPSIDSPWVDYNRVIIKGKTYTVRSFSILIPEIISPIPTIVNNSNFRITGIDRSISGSPAEVLSFRPLETGEAYFLLATDPHEIVDKVTNQVIDPSLVTSTNNPFSLFYNLGEVFADISIAQTIFPPVRETSE